MGVDYDAIGGIGIELTEENIDNLISIGLFTRDEWDKNEYKSIEKIGLPYYRAGDSAYSGERNRWYLMVNGETLKEINDNAPEFVKILNSFGINSTVDELQVVCDLLCD